MPLGNSDVADGDRQALVYGESLTEQVKGASEAAFLQVTSTRLRRSLAS